MHIKLLLIFLLFSVEFAFAQTTGVIMGNVRDKNTAETIIGASIVVEQTTNGTATDIDGNYKLIVHVGNCNLKISSLGYQSHLKFNIVVTSVNTQVVNFEL